MGKNQGQTRGQRANNASDRGGQTEAPSAAKGDGQDVREGASKRSAAAPVKRSKEPKTYRATARGYMDGRIVEPDEVFPTSDTQGSWMEPVGKTSAKDARVQEAVDDTMASKKDDPSLETFSLEALQGEALRLGLTDATGLSKDDLIAAIRAAYVNQAQ